VMTSGSDKVQQLSSLISFTAKCNYLQRRLASGEVIVTLGICVCVCVCVSAEPRLHATLVSAEKVMRCIKCCQSGLTDTASLKFCYLPNITYFLLSFRFCVLCCRFCAYTIDRSETLCFRSSVLPFVCACVRGASRKVC